jgi:hypothetical protein
MNFQKILKQATDIALLKKPAMEAVASDKNALKPALGIVAAVAVISILGQVIFPASYAGGYIVFSPDAAWIVSHLIWQIFVSVAALYLTAYLAVELFKSKLPMDGLVKVMGFGMIVMATAIIPSLSFVGAIWALVVTWKVLTDLGKLDSVEIIVLLVIDVILLGMLNMLLLPMFY